MKSYCFFVFQQHFSPFRGLGGNGQSIQTVAFDTVWGLPAAEGDGRGNYPDPCHEGETCHPRNEDFRHDAYRNLAVIGTCWNADPRGSFSLWI